MSSVDILGACQRCTSRRAIEGRLHCTDRVVCGSAAAVPCEQARQRMGGCGWDATRMNWPEAGIRPRLAPMRARTTHVPLQVAA